MGSTNKNIIACGLYARLRHFVQKKRFQLEVLKQHHNKGNLFEIPLFDIRHKFNKSSLQPIKKQMYGDDKKVKRPMIYLSPQEKWRTTPKTKRLQLRHLGSKKYTKLRNIIEVIVTGNGSYSATRRRTNQLPWNSNRGMLGLTDAFQCSY